MASKRRSHTELAESKFADSKSAGLSNHCVNELGDAVMQAVTQPLLYICTYYNYLRNVLLLK